VKETYKKEKEKHTSKYILYNPKREAIGFKKRKNVTHAC
jgi:hypothetical protein